jgi:hypothetical protein
LGSKRRGGGDGADMAEAISFSQQQQQQQTHNVGRGGRPMMWRLGKTKIRLD